MSVNLRIRKETGSHEVDVVLVVEGPACLDEAAGVVAYQVAQSLRAIGCRFVGGSLAPPRPR